MYYFFSDVHLGLFKREIDKIKEKRLLNFLELIGKDAQTIFILGDLFDFWFDYERVIPSIFFRVINKLYYLKEKDIEIIYLMGNHDFGHYKFFNDELGIKVITTDLSITLKNKKFYLAHGDGKVYRDYGYMILKKILRNRVSQFLYRLIHPDFGIWLASSSSNKSRKYTDKKNYGKIDGLEIFAKKKIDEGYDYVLMGHNHDAKEINYKNGKYINLGEWINNPTYAKFDGNNLELFKFNEF